MSDTPIREAVAVWLAEGGPAAPVSPHWRRTRASLAVHLVAAVGERPCCELNAADIWAVQRHCRELRGLSAETTNKVTHHLLPAMLRDLEAGGLLPAGTRQGAMAGAKKLRAESTSSGVALSIEDRDRVLRAFRGHWAAALVHFLFFTGLRIGEACGLRQRDIDWARRLARVHRSRRRDEVSATKSRRSQRTISLPHPAVAAIARLRQDDQPDGYLFRGARGAPLDADVFRRRVWGPRLARGGCRPIRIHDTRHTFATLALEAGVPAAKVAAYLGDKVSTLEERYSHVLAMDDWDAAVSAPPRMRAVR